MTSTSPKGMDTKHRIYELFVRNKRLRFSDIEKSIGIKSNTLTYHLNSMVKEGMLQKEDDEYQLSAHGEKLLPFFAHITQRITGGCLPVVLAAIVKDNQILRQRNGPTKILLGAEAIDDSEIVPRFYSDSRKSVAVSRSTIST